MSAEGLFSMRANSLYKAIFDRSLAVLGERNQRRLARSRVVVAGLGGVGAMAAEMLARSGVGELVLIDCDTYELSNLNRQLHSGMGVLGEKKVDVVAERLKETNPVLKIGKVAGRLDARNAGRILKGADVAIDGLDTAFDRALLARASRKAGIPYVFGSAAGAIGMSTVFMPGSGWTYEKTFRLPKDEAGLKAYPRCDAILGIVSNMVGLVEATQAVKLLLGWKVVAAPDIIRVDLGERSILSVKKLD